LLLGSSIIGSVNKGLSLEDSDLDKMLTDLARLFVMSPSPIGYQSREMKPKQKKTTTNSWDNLLNYLRTYLFS